MSSLFITYSFSILCLKIFEIDVHIKLDERRAAWWDWKENKKENEKMINDKNWRILILEVLWWQNLISIISSFVFFIASYSTILIHDIPNRGVSVIFHLSYAIHEELFLEILHVMALLIFHQRNFRKICRKMGNFNIHVYLIEIWMLRVSMKNLRTFLISYPKFMIAICSSKMKTIRKIEQCCQKMI